MELLNQDSRGTLEHRDWTLLQTIWGPSPYWTRVDPHSSIKVEDTCRNLYAVTDGMSTSQPPILALVRKPNEDYPVAICKHRCYMPPYSDYYTAVSQDPDKTISKSFLEADASLDGINLPARSRGFHSLNKLDGIITSYSRLEEDSDTPKDLSDVRWASIPWKRRDPHSLTNFIITTKECMWPYLSTLNLITQFHLALEALKVSPRSVEPKY
jgi:hypothetical protein